MKNLFLILVLGATSVFADDTNAIYQTNFQQLIGQDLKSQNMRKFFSYFDNEPILKEVDSSSYYEFRKEGITLGFDNYKEESGRISTVLETVTLYGRNEDGFTPYNGLVPFGLNFSMTRGEVEQKLGPPGASAVSGFSYNATGYYTKFLSIHYTTNSEEIASNNMKIVYIILR